MDDILDVAARHAGTARPMGKAMIPWRTVG